MEINSYKTVTEAIQQLAKRGFTGSSTIEQDGLHSMTTGKILRPADVTIVEYHRFEGESNPDDMSVVYALECKDGSKGILVDAYGAYADPVIGDFLKNVRLKEGL